MSSAPSAGSHSLLKSALVASVFAGAAWLAYRSWRLPRSVRPGINDPFASPESASSEFVGRFEVESREIFTRAPRVVELLNIKPGMRVADLGAGTGLFVELLARAVASSESSSSSQQPLVYALDPYPKFTSHIRERVSQWNDPALASLVRVQQNSFFSMSPPLSQGHARGDVEPEAADAARLSQPLPRESLDLVISIDSYHHYEHPLDLMRSVHSTLKSGGRLAVLDFVREEGVSSPWVMGHVRAGQPIVRKEIESAGFRFIEDIRTDVPLQENYLMIFEKA